MGREFTFYDYVDADGDGANVIKRWLNEEGKPAKAHFMMKIRQLEVSPPPLAKDTIWREPSTKLLRGKWDGFIELRKTGSVQYRLIGKIHGRSVFLVTHGIHKGGNYMIGVSPETAVKRVAQMISNPAKYGRQHEDD